MPIGGVPKSTTVTAGAAKRPPWVKEKETTTPETAPSWTQKKLKPVESKVKPAEDKKPAEETASPISHKLKPTLKKQTTVKESVPDKTENGVSDEKLVKPSERLAKEDKATRNLFKPKVKTEEKPKTGLDKLVPANDVAKKPPSNDKLPPRKPPLARAPSKDEMGPKKWRDPLLEKKKDTIDKTINNEIPKGHTLTKNESLRSLLKPTPPPPPPPPPTIPPPPEFKREPPSADKLKKLESLKSRPRKRPDWSDMMKEVEEGKKLKHVVCNDRSSPIITTTAVVKDKGQFVFESETEKSHNELLKQIEGGIKLKKVKTNDRSKPNLEGLRKFRRQMTIEEQLQKSMSQANLSAAPTDEASMVDTGDIDEMDDIDKVRDDLQSTKQLLQMELRNKEAMERENKRLLTRINNLEAEVQRERAIIKQEQSKTVISVTDAYDEKLVASLKLEVDRAKTTADELEKKYLAAAEERDSYQSEVEELRRKNAELEKKMHQCLSKGLLYNDPEEPKSFYAQRQLDFQKQCRLLNMKCPDDFNNDADEMAQGIMPSNTSSRRSSHAIKQLSVQKDSSFEEEDEESSIDEDETEEKKHKRLEKDVKNMRNRIRHLKMKQDHQKSERMALKHSFKNQQLALKEEKKKFKELKREVKKMADMMKEVGSDEEEEEEDEVEEEEEKEEESESEESETDAETEDETESESEPEDAPLPKKKENLSKRVKRHENRCTALQKSNKLLQANVDRLKDDFLKQKDASVALKKELDGLIEDLE